MSNLLRVSAALLTGLLLSPSVLAHEGDPKLLDKRPAYPGTGWRNAQRLAPGGSLRDSQPGVTFPSNNVTLLSWLSLPDLNVPSGGNGNSCFGYVSPSGREYAIIGLSTGTAFVEVTQPGNPVIVAQVAGPNSLWRDMRTFQNYCYAISEGGSGIQVINLANIDNGQVTLVNTINDDAASATHTLAINTQSGYLYRSGGGSNGLRIYNLNNNPAAPQRVGTWADRYSHEVSVFSYTTGPAAGKELAYVCGGLNGGYNSTGVYVVDVTNHSAPSLVKYISYPNSWFAHQVWPSADRQWLYLDDELDEQNLGVFCRTRVFNNSNPLDVTYTGFFTNGGTSIDHNLYTRDDKIYASNYRSGLRIFQTTSPGTPQNPVEIAYFDTWPEDNQASFNGLWNNYPYFPSGTVIGSDLEKGLFVWWIGTPPIVFTLPNGAPSMVSPAGQSIAVQIDESSPGTLQPGTAKLHYSTGGPYTAVDLVAQGGNAYLANLPATPCGSTVSWYLTGLSTNGIVWSDPQGAPNSTYNALSATGVTTLFQDNFETNLGWAATVAGASAGGWQRGVPVNDPAWDYDPASDSDGSGQCYLTQNTLGNSDVDGGTVTLTSPAFDMSSGSPKLSYDYFLNLTVTDGTDRLLVQINSANGAGAWTTIATHTTSGGLGWRHNDITSAQLGGAGVALTSTMKIRFSANDGGTASIVEAGLDAFKVESVDCAGNPIAAYCFGDGSLATGCPCGNFGQVGHGCDNSLGNGGAELAATGSTNPDSVVMTATDEIGSSLSIFLQGNTNIANGTPFGDGVRCAGGSLKRLFVKNASGGTVTAPEPGDPSVTAMSAILGDTIAPGSTRYYQVYYRDSNLGFCPSGDSFNISNALSVAW